MFRRLPHKEGAPDPRPSERALSHRFPGWTGAARPLTGRAWRVALVVVIVGLAAPAGDPPSAAVTQAEVDEACADYRDAKERLDAAIAERDDAQARYAVVYADRSVVSDRVDALDRQIAERNSEVERLRELVVEWAVEAYMATGAEISDIVLSTRSLEDLITGQEFLKEITTDRLASVDRLTLIIEDTQGMVEELRERKAELLVIEADTYRVTLLLDAATDEALDAARQLRGECRRLYEKRRAELALAAARAAALRSGGAGGVSAAATPGFICPMDKWAVSFINDWGFPRSGGRRHKGNDLFAPKGQPVKAVAGGTVALRTGGLGGISLWLSADNGVDYYYAHLNGYARGITGGVRVSRGQVIAYNGNTGNARGGAPHLHFQLHPSGRTGPAVNPFPTLARTCR